ncbi:TniQ family protein [Rhodocyclus tenuis]|uniref:TniQ family protein n=1 Tax=Rhodocyclus tenuis TaxID=1066 RepID=UPI0019046E39|nr:hypothetical protein [Rhodocyclus tenuis]
MSRLTNSGQLWLYRSKPQDDELLSSWLVRLASGLAIKLQTFCTQILGLHSGYWTGDIDRHPSLLALSRLSEGTAVPLDRVKATSLGALEGRLWERYQSGGPMEWLTPLGSLGRRRAMHGQQYCRQCLESDAQPYFRRRWRLAFNVACERHGAFLEDACPHCHGPVEFHTGDFGRRLLDFDCPITRCGACNADFRQWRSSADRKAPSDLLIFQSSLNEALQQGHHSRLPGAESYSHLFFMGLRHLVRNVCSRGRFSRVREWLLSRQGLLNFEFEEQPRWQKFEALRVGDRALILDLVSQLIQDWPHAFVRACQESKVSSSYILSYGAELPFWLSSEIDWHLYDRDYAPTPAERAAVERYLLNHGLAVSRNSINRWLGVASVSKLLHAPARRDRWNPRGAKRTRDHN